MAIAVLMPQDCLPTSRRRLKSGFSQSLHRAECAPLVKHGALQASLVKNSSLPCQDPLKRVPTGRSEWIVKVGASASLHDHNIQKEDGGRKTKARKSAETRGSMKAGSEGPPFTILARPKSGEAAEEVFGAFPKKVNGQKAVQDYVLAEFPNSTSGGPPDLLDDESKAHHSMSKQAAESKMVAYKLKKGALDSKCVIRTHPTLVLDKKEQAYWSSEERKADRRHSHAVVGAARPISNGNIGRGGLVLLRRASTDPQIVKHLVGHHNSEAVDIPLKMKSCHGFAITTSMSCPERWAGPAYSSSPPPSSLPLPRFSLPNPKMLSHQNSSDMLQLPAVPNMVTLQVSSKREAMDVDLATKSLRRMLKLDPC